MKRIATGDIHLSGYKNDQLHEDGLPLRLSFIINTFSKICSFAKSNGIDNVDILGDIHSDKDIIYTDAQNSFIDVINRFPSLQFTIFSGNHDKSSKGDYNSTAIQPLDSLSNVECIFRPTVIDNITVIPWSTNIAEEVAQTDSTDILLSHFGLNEAQLSSGISIVADISLKMLSKFKLVLLGHYHKPQHVVSKYSSLYYTGNLVHLNWNDKNDKKRFLVYDTRSLQVESYALSGPREYREFIIDETTEDPNSIIEQAKDLKSQGHYVIIRKKKSDVVLENISDLIVMDETKVEKNNDRGFSITMTRKEQLERYMEIKEIEESRRVDYLKTASILMGENNDKH